MHTWIQRYFAHLPALQGHFQFPSLNFLFRLITGPFLFTFAHVFSGFYVKYRFQTFTSLLREIDPQNKLSIFRA